MPNHPRISLLEFLRTGRFGDLGLGMHVSELFPMFGDPTYTKTNKSRRGKWVYKDVEFWINEESQRVYAIWILGFSDTDSLGAFPRINKRYALDPWVLRWSTGLENTLRALKSANLMSQHKLYDQLPSYESLELESGVTIMFRKEPEESKLVFDAIGIGSNELARTSQD
jgi:hypothetical protein